jgi:DNA-directed RNA polymerase
VNGIAPNFVHSMDASHLMLCVQKCVDDGIHDFWMVHDSFGTHASNAGQLSRNIRSTFVQMYTDHDVLEDFAHECSKVAGDEIPEPPTKGDFDLQVVTDSEYFFA